MIWFIIGLIISVILIIYFAIDEWWSFFEGFWCSILILLVMAIASSLVWFTASVVISSCTEPNYSVIEDTKIVALKDNQNIHGNFYIMGGYVNEDLYYYYATETEFGYKTEKISSDNAYIKYTDGEPHIEKYTAEFSKDSANIWGVPLYSDRYVIYCPEGTVTNEFKVDLE